MSDKNQDIQDKIPKMLMLGQLFKLFFNMLVLKTFIRSFYSNKHRKVTKKLAWQKIITIFY